MRFLVVAELNNCNTGGLPQSTHVKFSVAHEGSFQDGYVAKTTYSCFV